MRRPYPLVRLLFCAECGSHYRGDACNGIRRLRHVTRPACADSLTHRADIIEEQVAALLDGVRLSEADVEAVLDLIRLPPADEPAPQALGRDERRAALQEELATGKISLETFTRAWRALDRPTLLVRDPDREALETARRYLARLRRAVARCRRAG